MGFAHNSFSSQLRSDYDRHSFCGWLNSTFLLPAIIMPKEDALSQEDTAGDMSDPEVIKEIERVVAERFEVSFKKEPYCAKVFRENFLEMAEKGVFKLE